MHIMLQILLHSRVSKSALCVLGSYASVFGHFVGQNFGQVCDIFVALYDTSLLPSIAPRIVAMLAGCASFAVAFSSGLTSFRGSI